MPTVANRPITYAFDADTAKFAAGARRVEHDLQEVSQQAARTDQALDLDVDVDDTALGRLRRRMLEVRAEVEQRIRTDVELDAGEALRDLRRIDGQLRALDRMDVKPEVKVDVDKDKLAFITTEVTKLATKLPGVAGSLAGMGPAGLAAAGGLAALAGAAAITLGPGTIGAALFAGGFTAGKGLLEAFDALDKAGRKAEIVFGDQLKTVQKWADGLSTSVGLGSRDITAAAASIQDLLVPKGFSRSDAAAITQEVYERGAALAEFNGVDTAQGVDAVTAALLGQRKQLKGLGVDITAKEVAERSALLKGQEGYEDYNAKMLDTVATQQLLEEKSTDAWTAFTTGSSAADDALDTFNATLANLKTDAIEGFGGILAGIIGDLGGVNGGLGDLGDWIDAHRDDIRKAFVDIAIAIGNGAIAALDLAGAIVRAVVDTAPAVADLIRGFSDIAAAAQLAVGATLMLNPLTFNMGRDIAAAAGATRDMGHASADAYEQLALTFGPTALAGIDKTREGVTGVVGSLEDLAALDDLRISMVAELDQGHVDQVEDELDYLTADQLAVIVANIDPKTASKSENQLRDLAKTREAEIRAYESGADAVERELDSLTALRYAKIKFTYYDPRTGTYSSGGNLPKTSATPSIVVPRTALSATPTAAAPPGPTINATITVQAVDSWAAARVIRHELEDYNLRAGRPADAPLPRAW